MIPLLPRPAFALTHYKRWVQAETAEYAEESSGKAEISVVRKNQSAAALDLLDDFRISLRPLR